LLMRLTDALLSFPLFFFMLTILALFGSELYKIVLVIAAASWMTVARVVRAEALRTRSLDFVQAAHCLGGTELHIIRRHVIPQSVPSIIVAATLNVAAAILTESSLSYLGLGVRPPTPSWGNMLSNATSYLWQTPWLAFFPGAAIFLVVLFYNALGDGIRDAFDPTTGE
jgi:peptide/nickel transport system permease protein